MRILNNDEAEETFVIICNVSTNVTFWNVHYCCGSYGFVEWCDPAVNFGKCKRRATELIFLPSVKLVSLKKGN